MVVSNDFNQFARFRVYLPAFALADLVRDYFEIVHFTLLVDDFEGG